VTGCVRQRAPKPFIRALSLVDERLGRARPYELAETDGGRRIAESATVPDFQSGVVHCRELVVCDRRGFTQILLEPACNFGPAPQPVSVAGVGDGFRKISGAARAVHQKPDTFARPAGAGRYVRQGSQPGVRDTDDLDALQRLQVVDGRQYSVIQRIGLAIEVDILHAVAGADRRVVTTGFKQPINRWLVLKVGPVDDQSELEGGHVWCAPLSQTPRCGHRAMKRLNCLA